MNNISPWLYDLAMTGPTERLLVGRWRRPLVYDLRGLVLEVGAGTGLSLRHFRPGAHVVATEIDASSLSRLEMRAEGARATVWVASADGAHLPFPDGLFDAYVCHLALCTIPDPERALVEAQRVLKPGAPLRLLEHVRSTNRVWSWAQDKLAPTWHKWAGGCNLNQETERLVRRAGLHVEKVERHAGLLLPVRSIWARTP